MQIHPRLYDKLYTDAPPSVPVILYYRRPPEEVRSCIQRRYGPIKYELPFINAMALELPTEKIPHIAREPMIQWITEDAAVSKVETCIPSKTASGPAASKNAGPALIDSHFDPFVGFYSPAPQNLLGGGFGRPKTRIPVAVAAIDTGVAPHRDLILPVNRIRAFYDLVGHKTEPYDDDGHGTHIAGILCGLASPGAISRPGDSHRRPTGPALVAIKALDHQGNGNASDILAAMQWTLNNSRFYNIRVVNLSLGVTADEDYDKDPLVRGVEALTRYGLSVVAAAGNSGPDPSTISSPGTSIHAITVGAAEGDRVASFSSRGPTPQGLIKPDLVAPGVNILSLAARPASGGDGTSTPTDYVKQSGTSMAAPFVSRAIAAGYANFPLMDPGPMKRMLLRSVVHLPDEPATAQGYGLLLE